MKFNYLKVASAALMLSLTLTCNIANAALILFTTTGMVTSSNDSNILSGEIVNVGIYADDNGTGLFDNTWRASDLLNGYIEIGSYRLDIADNWFGNGVVYSTDAYGLVTAKNFGTRSGVRTDNYGTNSIPKVNGNWAVWNTKGEDVSTSVRAMHGWNVEAKDVTQPVPEPYTLAIFALGLIGLASRRFKKQS